MKQLLLLIVTGCCMAAATAQPTDVYNLVKKLIPDSTGYENIGNWGVGNPKIYPVKWKADKIEMSDDTSINFYRMGTVDLTLNGRKYLQAGQPVKWNIMLKGPRMGYSSFSIISSPSKDFHPKYTLDSLFGNKPYKARLIKSCDANPMSGFYFYEVKIPKEDVAFLKLSWLSLNGNTGIRIDGYDSYSRYAAKLGCPK